MPGECASVYKEVVFQLLKTLTIIHRGPTGLLTRPSAGARGEFDPTSKVVPWRTHSKRTLGTYSLTAVGLLKSLARALVWRTSLHIPGSILFRTTWHSLRRPRSKWVPGRSCTRLMRSISGFVLSLLLYHSLRQPLTPRYLHRLQSSSASTAQAVHPHVRGTTAAEGHRKVNVHRPGRYQRLRGKSVAGRTV